MFYTKRDICQAWKMNRQLKKVLRKWKPQHLLYHDTMVLFLKAVKNGGNGLGWSTLKYYIQEMDK